MPRFLKLLRFPLPTLAALFIAATIQSAAQKIISFDAPGAGTIANPFVGTFPTGMNNEGAIAGAYIDANQVYHGFLRTPKGNFVTFQAPGADTTPGSFNGTGTYTMNVNDLGAITGNYTDAQGISHGFVRSPEGKFRSFDPVGSSSTFPIAINLEGGIVGFYADSNSALHAFSRSPDGKLTTWSGPNSCTGNGAQGCFGSGASNINAFGVIAGGFEDNSGNFVHHNFVRDARGNQIVFDIPGAGTGAYQGSGSPGCFLGLNQWGAIAGIYSDSNSVNHGFIRNPWGQITTFDAPGAATGAYQGTGCYSDCPVSINDWGAVTGVYTDANYAPHGYLRSPEGKFVTVDPTGSVATWPYAINDEGIITGYYADANNVYHGFVRITDH